MGAKKLKVGIIGVGGRGEGSFATLMTHREDTEIVAFCDLNPERMKAAAALLKIKPRYYLTPADMLAKEDLDAAVITTPDFCHAEHASAALNAGVNVLIDKPLATTVEGCRQVIAAAKKSKKVALMGFNLRHSPALKRLKEIVAAGTLGNIFLIENREFYDGGKTYMSRWNRQYKCSGGLWIHKGSHDFDVFNWLLDFPRPLKVSATAGVNVLNADHLPFEKEKGKKPGPCCSECYYAKKCPDFYDLGIRETMWTGAAKKRDNYAKDTCMYLSDKDTHDNGIAIVEYANGARASHLECFVTSFTDRLYTVVGDKGQAEVSLHDLTILIRPRWSRETILHKVPPVIGGHGGADPSLVDDFVKICRGEKENTSTLEHGMLSTAVGQAAELSWREDRVVFVKELLK